MSSSAVYVTAFDMANPLSGVEVVSVPVPQPGQGEVCLRMTLRPVNPADLFSLMGVYPGFQPAALPAVPGLEGVGVVEANGPGASKFAPGTRVVGTPFSTVHGGGGTWTQHMVVPESCLVAVAEGVSDDAAAQFFVNPVTVVGMLEVLEVPEGEYLLQTAAGSVLGRQMIEVAKSRGIKTINVVRREALGEELKAMGADEIIVSGEEDIAARVNEITGGKGAYGAIECVGGELTGQVAAGVRAGGTVILFGAMSGLTVTLGIPDVLFRNVCLRGFWVAPWVDSLSASKKEEVMAKVMGLLADGVITPHSGTKFPLAEVKEAIAAATADARGGKVLLEG